MSDHQQTDQPPPFGQEPGWRVIDPDGNVVASGGVTIAQADGRIAELLAGATNEEGAQE